MSPLSFIHPDINNVNYNSIKINLLDGRTNKNADFIHPDCTVAKIINGNTIYNGLKNTFGEYLSVENIQILILEFAYLIMYYEISEVNKLNSWCLPYAGIAICKIKDSKICIAEIENCYSRVYTEDENKPRIKWQDTIKIKRNQVRFIT